LGGAIFARSGTVSIANSTFSSNQAANGSGGASGSLGPPFSYPGAAGQGVGGAIFVLNASLDLVNPTFTGNTASTAQPNVAGSTIVVNTNDTGGGSLRQAVLVANYANTPATITFTNTLSGQTITLTSGALSLSGTVTIDASPLAAGIQINGNASDRVFSVAGGSTVVLDSLTIANGRAVLSSLSGNGGGIHNLGNLTVNRCTLEGNYAQ
jgi:hypothetical protein